MKNLVIVGAGGFGREVLAWAEDVCAATGKWTIKGFLDDNSEALTKFGSPKPVLGSVKEYQPELDDEFLIAIGTPATRLKVAESLAARGAVFATLVHPTAIVGPRVELGEGTIICPRCVVTCDVKIGRHVILNAAATVGHDAQVGDGCTINGHCDVTGFASLGEGTFLGSHAAVAPGIRTGRYSVVGASSVAIRNVPDLATVFGVPAKKIFGHEPIVDENWQP